MVADAKQKGSELIGEAKQKGSELIGEAKEMGSELIGAARDSAVSMLDTQRGRAADQISAVAEALRRSAQSIDQDSGVAVGRYADQAARQISDFAETVRSRSWSELAGDTEDFARRWPMAFMASALAVGFIAGRFMLSSAGEGGAGTTNQRTNPRETQYGGAGHDARTGVAPAAGSSGMKPAHGSPGSSTHGHRP